MRGDDDLSAFEQSLRDAEQHRSPADDAVASAVGELSDAAERYVGLDPARTVPGNRFKHLRDGVEAFPEMLDAIRTARRKIRLEVYMFIDDAVGELFARALADAAGRGVQVKVLYDWLGSLSTRRAFF